jgi:hypothetical protein
MLKKAVVLTHPTPARQDALFHRQGRSEVRGAKNNEGARRDEEGASCLRTGVSR